MGRSVTEYFEKRREETRKRFDDLRAKLKEAEKVFKDRACVYVTGSFGREEASSHSDLDLFIVGRTIDPLPGQEQAAPCA